MSWEQDWQQKIRSSSTYKRAGVIVELMGYLGRKEILASDTVEEVIEKLKALNERERGNG